MCPVETSSSAADACTCSRPFRLASRLARVDSRLSRLANRLAWRLRSLSPGGGLPRSRRLLLLEEEADLKKGESHE